MDKHTGEEELVAVKVFNKSVLNKQARKTAFRQRKKHAKVSEDKKCGDRSKNHSVPWWRILVHGFVREMC